MLRALGTLLTVVLLGTAAKADFIIDAKGDFISTYTGAPVAALDVISAGGFYDSTNFYFTARMAGVIDFNTLPTGSSYVWGFDRGAGTARFASIGITGVLFDSVVAITPTSATTATGRFNDLVTAANSFNLASSDFQISGDTISFKLAISSIPSLGLATNKYTWNLWPRAGGGNNLISDFAPNNSNAALSAVPEPTSAVLLGLGGLAVLGMRKRRRSA